MNPRVSFVIALQEDALDGFPTAYAGFSPQIKAQGWRYYEDSIYQSLSL
jgi:carbamoylphosphate synthase large subunit